MSSCERNRLALAILLTAVAGLVDAVAFLRLSQLFVSFMSGNSTRFVVFAVHDELARAARSGAAIGLFVFGAMLGRLIAIGLPRWRRPVLMAIEAVLLVAAVFVSRESNLIVLLVLAMGLQNAVIRHAAGTKTGLTYVTGTLVNVGEKLAEAVTPAGRGRRFAWLVDLGLWIGLLCGGVLGAIGFLGVGMRVLLAPAMLLAILAVVTAFRPLS